MAVKLSVDHEQRIYDPDKARYHLKKAGMEGIEVDLGTGR